MINWLLFVSFWAVQLSISALIAAISVLLSAFEHFSALLFELASDWYGVPPRASFPTEKCAVLILGAHEGAPITLCTRIKHRQLPSICPGVGRNAALSFSELGYTVFALCPNRAEEVSGPRLTSGRSRDVASVRSVHPRLFLGSGLSHRPSKASVHLAQQKGAVSIDPLGPARANATQSLVSIPARSCTRDRPCPLCCFRPPPRSIARFARQSAARRHKPAIALY